MGEGQDRVQVAASPEAVWKVIADIEGHARLAGSSEILAIRFQGPLRVGARWEADERITGVGRFTADHYHDIAAHLGLFVALAGLAVATRRAGLVGPRLDWACTLAAATGPLGDLNLTFTICALPLAAAVLVHARRARAERGAADRMARRDAVQFAAAGARRLVDRQGQSRRGAAR